MQELRRALKARDKENGLALTEDDLEPWIEFVPAGTKAKDRNACLSLQPPPMKPGAAQLAVMGT
jgi:hypothetical protein